MYKYPWMKSWVILFSQAGDTDVSGNALSAAYACFPARVTYGDRFVLTAQGGLAVFQAEVYTVQEAYDWYKENNGVNHMIEISYDYGSGTLDGSTIESGGNYTTARDYIMDEIDTNGESYGDLVIPDTFMLKRSLYNRQRGYYYLGRSGGEG